MNLLGAVWSNNALSTLRASPNPAFPSRNCLSQFGLGESVLKPLFSGSHWVSRTSACENCCCDFLLSPRIDVCQRDAPPRGATTTCYWSRGYTVISIQPFARGASFGSGPKPCAQVGESI